MKMRAILFDVYGTLLDVHSAITRIGNELGEDAAAVSGQWRQKQLEYS
jgi:2-haloacid dehalogenase